MKERTLEEKMRFNNSYYAKMYFPFLKDFFSTEGDLIKFFDDFLQFYDLKNLKELKDLQDFRWAIPLRICQIIKLKQDLDNSKIQSDGLKLILLTSIIELLKTKINYVDFSKWYKNQSKDLECVEAWRKYNKIHGSTKKFREFFFILDRQEKIDLITSIISDRHNKRLPLCYDEKNNNKCFDKNLSDLSICYHYNDNNKCPLYCDDKILNASIKTFSNFLYDMRNKFVHMGQIPLFARDISEKAPSGGGIVYDKSKVPPYQISVVGDMYEVDNKVAYIDSELSVEKLYRLLKKHWHELINEYFK